MNSAPHHLDQRSERGSTRGASVVLAGATAAVRRRKVGRRAVLGIAIVVSIAIIGVVIARDGEKESTLQLTGTPNTFTVDGHVTAIARAFNRTWVATTTGPQSSTLLEIDDGGATVQTRALRGPAMSLVATNSSLWVQLAVWEPNTFDSRGYQLAQVSPTSLVVVEVGEPELSDGSIAIVADPNAVAVVTADRVEVYDEQRALKVRVETGDFEGTIPMVSSSSGPQAAGLARDTLTLLSRHGRTVSRFDLDGDPPIVTELTNVSGGPLSYVVGNMIWSLPVVGTPRNLTRYDAASGASETGTVVRLPPGQSDASVIVADEDHAVVKVGTQLAVARSSGGQLGTALSLHDGEQSMAMGSVPGGNPLIAVIHDTGAQSHVRTFGIG